MDQIERLTMKIERLQNLKPDLKPGFFLTDEGYLGFNSGLEPDPRPRKLSELKVGDILTSSEKGWSYPENKNVKFVVTEIRDSKFILKNEVTKKPYEIHHSDMTRNFKDLT